MQDELTNLLPSERQRTLRKSYLMRFGIVTCWLFSALVIIAMALLLPTYFYAMQAVEATRDHLSELTSANKGPDESVVALRLSALSIDAERLSALKNAPTASSAIRAILAVSHPNVQLLGFSYTPKNAKGVRTLAVSGSADTRSALRDYQIALESNPLVENTQLPVSTYAQETDIAFTITLTLKSSP